MRRIFLPFLITLFFVSCKPESNPSRHLPRRNNELGWWLSKPDIPRGVQEIYPAYLNGKIYIFGGFHGPQEISRNVYIYDVADESWTTKTYPTYGHHLGTAVAGGKIYIIGGYGPEVPWNATNEVFEYDTDTYQLIPKSPMPSVRAETAIAVLNDKIFVIGGRAASNDEHLNIVEMYDPATDTWITVSSMPTPRRHAAASVIDDLIYVVGGRQFSGDEVINLATVEAYSPADDTWYAKPDMPYPSSGLAATTMNGLLYAFGGEYPTSNGTSYNYNFEYNPVSNSWREMTPMPTPRHGINAVTVGNDIYVVGGGIDAVFGVTAVNQAFTLVE